MANVKNIGLSDTGLVNYIQQYDPGLANPQQDLMYYGALQGLPAYQPTSRYLKSANPPQVPTIPYFPIGPAPNSVPTPRPTHFNYTYAAPQNLGSQKQADLVSEVDGWWGRMIQKYGLSPDTNYTGGTGYNAKTGDPIINPTQQETFIQNASPEDLKQYFKYDVKLKSIIGWSPFLVDSQDYGSQGLNWFDTSVTNGATGEVLSLDQDQRRAVLNKIDGLSNDDLNAARNTVNQNLTDRFNGYVKYANHTDWLGTIGMGLWTAGAGYIATAGAGAALAPIADIAGGSSSIAGTILGSDAAAGAAGGAATSAITGGDPLTGALAGGASGAVADFGGNKLSQAVTGQVVGSELTPAPQVPDTTDTPTPTQAPSNPYAGLYQSTPTLTAPKAPLQSQGIAPGAAPQSTPVNGITLNAPKAPSLIEAAKTPGQGATNANTSMAGMILSAPKVPTVKSGLIGQAAG
jgi:hypothetical protein